MTEFLKTQLPAIITGILGVGAYIFERKRKHAEVQKVESDALKAMQAAYKTFVFDLNSNYTGLKVKVDKLEAEVILWKAKYFELKNEVKKNKIKKK